MIYDAVFDIETTGVDPFRDQIIDICVIICDENKKEVERYREKVKPKNLKSIAWDAYEIHKISKDELVGAKSIETVLDDLFELNEKYDFRRWVYYANPNGFYTKDENGVINGYSYAHFDNTFIRASCDKIYPFDDASKKHIGDFGSDFSNEGWSFTLYRHLPKAPKGTRNSLDYHAKRIGFNLDHHQVVSDTECTFELYKTIEESWEEHTTRQKSKRKERENNKYNHTMSLF